MTDLQITEASSQEQLLTMLVGERFDVCLYTELVGLEIVKSLKLGNEVEQQPLVLAELPLYIAFSKTKGETVEKWAKSVSDALAKLKKDGVLDKILNSYLKSTMPCRCKQQH